MWWCFDTWHEGLRNWYCVVKYRQYTQSAVQVSYLLMAVFRRFNMIVVRIFWMLHRITLSLTVCMCVCWCVFRSCREVVRPGGQLCGERQAEGSCVASADHPPHPLSRDHTHNLQRHSGGQQGQQGGRKEHTHTHTEQRRDWLQHSHTLSCLVVSAETVFGQFAESFSGPRW